MYKRLLLVCLALTIFRFPDQLYAQFTAPRAYDNTPAGVNQLELAYMYAHTNASIDTSIIITGAKLNLNQGIVDYTRDFSFLHRRAWVEMGFPIAGLGVSVKRSGFETGCVISTSSQWWVLANGLREPCRGQDDGGTRN